MFFLQMTQNNDSGLSTDHIYVYPRQLSVDSWAVKAA